MKYSVFAVTNGAIQRIRPSRRQTHLNIKRFYDADGKPKNVHELSDEDAECVDSVQVILKNAEAGDGHIDQVHHLKIGDKKQAREILSRHLHIGDSTMNVVMNDEEVIARLNRAKERVRLAKAKFAAEREQKEKGRGGRDFRSHRAR